MYLSIIYFCDINDALARVSSWNELPGVVSRHVRLSAYQIQHVAAGHLVKYSTNSIKEELVFGIHLRKVQRATGNPLNPLASDHLSDKLYRATTVRAEFVGSVRLFNHSLNRSRYCWVDIQPRVHYQLNEATAEWRDRPVIDDAQNQQAEYERVISYSWFTARSWSHLESSVSFFSHSLFLFWHLFICTPAFELCLLHTAGSTQYSADKDRGGTD